VVPQLFEDHFGWFAGVAFAAIAIGALVPAAIMSIGAANLFTRNIWREFIEPGASPEREAAVSRIASLVVKAGALAFVLSLDKQNAINFQLLGGIWILQTLPSIVIGLYTRWFHRWALLAGWLVGMAYGTVSAYGQSSPTTKHFGASTAAFLGHGNKIYIALTALVLNLLVATVLTLIFRALKAPEGVDATQPDDYYAEEGDPRVTPIPELTG